MNGLRIAFAKIHDGYNGTTIDVEYTLDDGILRCRPLDRQSTFCPFGASVYFPDRAYAIKALLDYTPILPFTLLPCHYVEREGQLCPTQKTLELTHEICTKYGLDWNGAT